MKIKLIFSFLVTLLLLSVQQLNAQEVMVLTPEKVALADLQYRHDKYTNGSKTLNIQSDFTASRVKHQQELMHIAERAYDTQYWMTIAIFIIVAVLVLGGFYLSYLQFKADAVRSSNEQGSNKASFKIGKDGIEFSSSVIGLVVLFMSFMFFYLYVKDVYAIKVNTVQNVSFEDKST